MKKMKIQKGCAGYLRAKKMRTMITTILAFALVAAIVITGYITTHTRLNMLTLVAVLGCLPACRLLVSLIMLMPHHSIDEAKELEISGVTEELTVVYDLVVTSEKKVMPIEVATIFNNTVCGYVSSNKVDTTYAADHIKSIMKQNHLDKVTVKLFHDYKAFLTRAEGMNNIASVEQTDTRRHEEEIKEILLDISL